MKIRDREKRSGSNLERFWMSAKQTGSATKVACAGSACKAIAKRSANCGMWPRPGSEAAEQKQCDVCGRIVLVDSFGNGKCENCGWVQGKDEEAFEKANCISYPNLVPLSRAREQFAKGEPFHPTFEDFVNGLKFYGEMRFVLDGVDFEVFRKPTDFSVVFCSEDFEQVFESEDDFAKHAKIGGKLLADVWNDDVTDAGFMFCG